jgi:hypothetical protein
VLAAAAGLVAVAAPGDAALAAEEVVAAAPGAAAAPDEMVVAPGAVATAVGAVVTGVAPGAEPTEVPGVCAVCACALDASAFVGVGAGGAADCVTAPLATGGACCPARELNAPCVANTAISTGTSPSAGTSHHDRQPESDAPRLERTTWVCRGWGGM